MNRYLHYAVFFLFTLLLVGCADAGKDQEVASGALVTLDGNASKTDVYGQIREYRWKQIKIHGSVPKVQLSDKNAISPTFTAPTVTKKTILTFRLTTKEVEVNSVWQELGEKMGFDYTTARPVPGKGLEFFYAVFSKK